MQRELMDSSIKKWPLCDIGNINTALLCMCLCFLIAAHCFHNEKEIEFGYSTNVVKNYVFVVAKSTRDYHTKDSRYTKSFKVRNTSIDF